MQAGDIPRGWPLEVYHDQIRDSSMVETIVDLLGSLVVDVPLRGGGDSDTGRPFDEVGFRCYATARAGVQPDIAALSLLAQTLMTEAWSPVCSRDDMAQKLGSTMIWERGWMRRVELRKLLSTWTVQCVYRAR
jgi:hypothetical protein